MLSCGFVSLVDIQVQYVLHIYIYMYIHICKSISTSINYTMIRYLYSIYLDQNLNRGTKTYWILCTKPEYCLNPMFAATISAEPSRASRHTNWGLRREVQSFLDEHVNYVPAGWEDAEKLGSFFPGMGYQVESVRMLMNVDECWWLLMNVDECWWMLMNVDVDVDRYWCWWCWWLMIL